jgi:hypothetical protein
MEASHLMNCPEQPHEGVSREAREKILPCPSGHQANRTNWRNTNRGGRFYTSCIDCEWMGPWADTEAEAATAWNTRTPTESEWQAKFEEVLGLLKGLCDALHYPESTLAEAEAAYEVALGYLRTQAIAGGE